MEASIFDACLVTEEFAYGCTGISTAIETTGLGVSFIMNNFSHICQKKILTIVLEAN